MFEVSNWWVRNRTSLRYMFLQKKLHSKQKRPTLPKGEKDKWAIKGRCFIKNQEHCCFWGRIKGPGAANHSVCNIWNYKRLPRFLWRQISSASRYVAVLSAKSVRTLTDIFKSSVRKIIKDFICLPSMVNTIKPKDWVKTENNSKMKIQSLST